MSHFIYCYAECHYAELYAFNHRLLWDYLYSHNGRECHTHYLQAYCATTLRFSIKMFIALATDHLENQIT